MSMGKWTGREIPLDDRPAPSANRDRSQRITFDPATWPSWLVLFVFAVIILLATCLR